LNCNVDKEGEGAEREREDYLSNAEITVLEHGTNHFDNQHKIIKESVQICVVSTINLTGQARLLLLTLKFRRSDL